MQFREQRQQAALITSWQQSAVITERRVSHIFAHSSASRSEDCSSPVEGPLWNLSPRLTFVALWASWIRLCSHAHGEYDVQHRRPLLPPAGWPGGQHSWDKAGLFCSHDVMANKAPWWNWLTLWEPTVALHIDDVTHPHQPRLFQGQQGHEHEGGAIKVEGEVVCLPFASHRWQPPWAEAATWVSANHWREDGVQTQGRRCISTLQSLTVKQRLTGDLK